MRKLVGLLVGSFLAVILWTPASQAQDLNDIQQDRLDI